MPSLGGKTRSMVVCIKSEMIPDADTGGMVGRLRNEGAYLFGDRSCSNNMKSRRGAAPRPAGHNNHPFLPIFLRCKPRLPLPIIMRIRNQ